MLRIHRTAFVVACILVLRLTNAQDVNFLKFSQAEGLRHSQILDIAQDGNGNLWLGTATRSIYRFDGRKFFEYKMDLPGYNGTVYTFKVRPDRHNHIWVFSNLGLVRFDGREARVIPNAGNIMMGTHSMLVIDDLDRKWVIDEQGKLFEYSAGTLKKREDINSAISGRIVGYFQEQPHVLSFCAMNGSVATVDSVGSFRLDKLPWEGFDDMEFVTYDNNEFLVAHAGGLSIYSREKDLIRHYARSNSGGPVRQVVRDVDGMIWIQQGNELWTINTAGIRKRLSGSNSLAKNDVVSLFKDRDNGIWLSVDVMGILKYRKQPIRRIPGTERHDITAIAETPNGDLLFGTYGDGILGLKTPPLAGKPITSFAFGPGHALLVGTLKEGVFEISAQKTKKVFPVGESYLDVHGVTAIGDSLVIGSSSGLFILTPEGVKHVTKRENESVGMSSSIRVNDTVYFAGTGEGLMKLVGDSIVQVGPLFLNNSTVYNIRKQRSGNYAVTGEFPQIVWFDKDFRFKRTVDLGKTVSNVLIFEEVDATHWLVGSNDGLFRISLEHDSVKSVKKYGRVDGFEEDELYVGASVQRNGDSSIVIGTVNGAYQYDPGLEDVDAVPPHTYITNIEFRPLESYDSVVGYFGLPANLKLNFAENLITFGFSSSSLSSPYNIQYKYKLEGISEDWSPLTTSEKVTFSNLRPGQYVFRVQAISESRLWGSISSYSFEVLPAFWQTAWFYVLGGIGVVVLVLLAIVAFSAYRIRQHKREEHLRQVEAARIRKQMSMDFHDEMGNKLAGMLAQASHLKFVHRDSDLADTFDYFERNAFAIFHGTKDFIWTIDVNSNGLLEVLAYLRDFGFGYFERNAIAFHVEQSLLGPEFDVQLPESHNRQIILIFKEAMTNALKHSGCKNVYFGVRRETNGLFTITFSDDGTWRGGELMGNGLTNMKSRSHRMGSILSFNSANGKTCLELTIKSLSV